MKVTESNVRRVARIHCIVLIACLLNACELGFPWIRPKKDHLSDNAFDRAIDAHHSWGTGEYPERNFEDLWREVEYNLNQYLKDIRELDQAVAALEEMGASCQGSKGCSYTQWTTNEWYTVPYGWVERYPRRYFSFCVDVLEVDYKITFSMYAIECPNLDHLSDNPIDRAIRTSFSPTAKKFWKEVEGNLEQDFLEFLEIDQAVRALEDMGASCKKHEIVKCTYKQRVSCDTNTSYCGSIKHSTQTYLIYVEIIEDTHKITYSVRYAIEDADKY